MTLTIDEIFAILDSEIRKYKIMLDEETNKFEKIKLKERHEALDELYSKFLNKDASNQNELWLLRYGE